MLGRLERGGDGVDAGREHPVRPAEHGILLVHGSGDAAEPGGDERGEGRVAAEPHDGARAHLAQQLERRGDAAQERPAGPGGSKQ